MPTQICEIPCSIDICSASVNTSQIMSSLILTCWCASGKARASWAQSLHRAFCRRAARERPRLPGRERGMLTRSVCLTHNIRRVAVVYVWPDPRYRSVLALNLSSRLLFCSSEGILLCLLPTRTQMATFCSSMVSLSWHSSDEEDADKFIHLIIYSDISTNALAVS